MHTEHLAKWQTHKSLGMLPWMTRDRRYSRQQVLSPYSPPAAAQSACDASANIIQAPQQLLLMRILLSSPVCRWGDRGFRKVTKLKSDCTWNCKSIEEEWLLSQELPGCIINEKTEAVQKEKKKEYSGKVTETQRRVLCDEFDEAVFAVQTREKGQPQPSRLRKSRARVWSLCWPLSLALLHSHTLCLQPGASRGTPLSCAGLWGSMHDQEDTPHFSRTAQVS